MDWNQVLGPVLAGLGIIITALCTWLSARIVAWLNAKIKDKQAANFACAISTIIMNAVQSVFQTYVQALKEKGAFTEEAQKEALNKCLAIINGQLTTDLKNYITENYGDIEAYLKNAIEAMIYSLKTK